MLTNRKIIPVDVPAGVVGNWKETYQWIPIFGGIAAFSLALSAGANNLPTSVCLLIIVICATKRHQFHSRGLNFFWLPAT